MNIKMGFLRAHLCRRALWLISMVFAAFSQGIEQDVKRFEEAAFGDVAKRAYECPVPCGYYRQLCCNRNEICYTAANLEAACAPTASPIVAITTITVPVTVSASTWTGLPNRSYTGALTYVVSTAAYTSLSTITSAITVTPSARLETSIASTATGAASASNGTSQADAGAQREHKRHLSKGAIAGIVVAGVGVGLGAFVIWRYCRSKRRATTHNSSEEEMEDQNFARVEQGIPVGGMRVDQPGIRLKPQPSVTRPGINPYEPSTPSSPAPSYPGSRSQTPVQAYGDPRTSRGNGFNGGLHPQDRPFYPVPAPDIIPRRTLRKPVGGMPSRVDSDHGG